MAEQFVQRPCAGSLALVENDIARHLFAIQRINGLRCGGGRCGGRIAEHKAGQNGDKQQAIHGNNLRFSGSDRCIKHHSAKKDALKSDNQATDFTRYIFMLVAAFGADGLLSPRHKIYLTI